MIVLSFKTAICLCFPTRLFARTRILVQERPGNKFKKHLAIVKLETRLSKVGASIDAGAPAMTPDWYPVEWVVWLHFGPSREFQYGLDSWLSPGNDTYASAGPDPSLHSKEAGKAARAAIPSRQELRRVNLDSPTGSVSSSSGTSTPSVPDPVEKQVATLKEANAIEQQRFYNKKKLHDIKLAETKLKNVNAILSNQPVGLSQAQLDRLQAQALYLTGIVSGLDFDDSGQQPTSRALALAPASEQESLAPASLAPAQASLAPASLAPAPASLDPASLAPASLAPAPAKRHCCVSAS